MGKFSEKDESDYQKLRMMMNKRIQKHVRQRNSHVFVGQPAPQTGGKRPFESLRELIGLISAGAGIFGVLLYLAGRSFASGYFAAMNIPGYQVSFSLWEYGEVAWKPMLLYPVLMLGGAGLFWGVIYTTIDWLSPLFRRLTNWLKSLIKIKPSTWRLPEISKHTRQWFILSLLASLAFISVLAIENTLQFVEGSGRLNGQAMVLERASQVELISTTPMALDDDNLAATVSSGQDYYVYKGLHLLTFNNGKYYLFKEIDQVTCKPLKVYVIGAEQNIQVNLLPAISLSDQCQKDKSSQVIATPISTQPVP